MLPEGFPERMARLLKEEYSEFLASYERPRSVGLRMNPCKGACVPDCCTERVPWAPDGYYYSADARPGLSPLHDAGAYYLQEPSAMAPAALLDAQPGERVLDLCAAPGGKSTQLAAAMRGKGLLVCNEIHPKRARILASNLERMGVGNALVLNEHPARLRFPAFFDRILVDVPCSGEGMFRKEEAAVTDWSQEIVEMCAARQSEILDTAAAMLRPGGHLVYSTCTFSPEENEGVVSRFLKSHPDFSVAQRSVPWFAPGRPDWVDDPAPGLEHTFRLWPHRLRGEGHFAALLERRGDGTCEVEAVQPAEKLPVPICEFLERNHVKLPNGFAVSFGDTWFWAPPELPALKGLHVLRAGLELGETRKGRFVPAHALALWLQTFPQALDLALGSHELAAYLRGETLPTDLTGWTLVRVGQCSLGWAYGAGGVLKNHYPKGLRKNF